ncbi:MAG: pyridoxal phosphate-dependent aminotransferase [Verrucomicrobia bacterium]|nr:pyridoxal phosphate-dependent aminotransferase [Verrucomicrobiota bacterium]
MEAAIIAKKISPSLTLAIDSKAKALKAEGKDICSFGAGEPDFDTPDHIKLAAAQALAEGFTKYTPSSGIPELRQAIAEKMKAENGVDYKPNQIIVSCGAKHSCYNAILATCNSGDEVIIPAPYWLSYPEMAKMAGAEPYIVQTTAENNYKMTPEQLQASISPSSRMVILNSPSNPTGSVYTENEMAALVEVALEDDLFILSDEIYEKVIYDDAKHFSIASMSKRVLEHTITVNGFSKSYAMTGWRLGYLAAAENIAKAVDSIQSHSTSNPTSFAQKGAVAALKESQECVAQMVKVFEERRKLILDGLNAIEGIRCVKPMGAFYVLPDISSFGMNSSQFCELLLDEALVAAVPGIAFGNDKTIRLSYACSTENIEKGISRLKDFCARIRK